MLRHPRRRRPLAIALIVAGALAIWLAPDNAWLGLGLFLFGVLVEVLGARLGG